MRHFGKITQGGRTLLGSVALDCSDSTNPRRGTIALPTAFALVPRGRYRFEREDGKMVRLNVESVQIGSFQSFAAICALDWPL
jgi:hypothetical protein